MLLWYKKDEEPNFSKNEQYYKNPVNFCPRQKVQNIPLK